MRHQDRVDALRRSVLEGEGRTTREVRAAVAGRGGDVPEELRGFVDAVRRHAYRITDEEVAALKRDGWSEDEIFEVTVATALGAGLERMEAALRAIEGAGK